MIYHTFPHLFWRFFQDKVRVYEIFILVENKEIKDTAEVVDRIVDTKQQHVINRNETWIQSTIILRYILHI